MKISRSLSFALLLAFTCLNARATVLTISTKGTLSGTDHSGWFAAPGTYLDSVDYSIRLSIEPDVQWPVGTINARDGAYLFGEAPILVTFSINNKNAPLGGYHWANKISVEINDGTPSNMLDNFSLSARATTIYGDPIFQLQQVVTSLDSNFAIASPRIGQGYYNVLPGESIGSQLSFYDPTKGYNNFVTTITSVAMTQTEGVIPEPGSLALFGIGLLVASRSRRKKLQ